MPRIILHEESGQPKDCLEGLLAYAARLAARPEAARFHALDEIVDWCRSQKVVLDLGEKPTVPGCRPQQRAREWPSDGLNCWEATAHFVAVALRLRAPIELHIHQGTVDGLRHLYPAVRVLGEPGAPEVVVLQLPLSRRAFLRAAQRAQGLGEDKKTAARRSWAQGKLADLYVEEALLAPAARGGIAAQIEELEGVAGYDAEGSGEFRAQARALVAEDEDGILARLEAELVRRHISPTYVADYLARRGPWVLQLAEVLSRRERPPLRPAPARTSQEAFLRVEDKLLDLAESGDEEGEEYIRDYLSRTRERWIDQIERRQHDLGSAERRDRRKDELLHRSLHGMEGSEARWSTLRAQGATDDELRAAISYEWGMLVGFGGTEGAYEARGGKQPQFTVRIGDQRLPPLKGKALLLRVRKLLAIPARSALTAAVVLDGIQQAAVLFKGLGTIPVTTFQRPDTNAEKAALALQIDLALREKAPSHWRGDHAREGEVLNALFPLLDRDRTATRAVFDLIKAEPVSSTPNTRAAPPPLAPASSVRIARFGQGYWHAMRPQNDDDDDQAECGVRPSYRSKATWQEAPPDQLVTCPSCLRRA